MATTTKKTKKTKKKAYKILWIDEQSLIVKVEEKIARGTIVRYCDVIFGDFSEDGNVPIRFTVDILDNPKNLDFESEEQYENQNNGSYLGNLIATVVMDSLNEQDGLIGFTNDGSDDGETGNTDSE